MANLNTNCHVHFYPDLEVTLKRFYCGDSNTQDQLGTIHFWKKYIDELYAQMPFKELWRNLVLEIWHMDHPDLLILSRDKKIPTLLDFKVDVPGYQTAVGLHFGNERIALGVFPTGWDKHNPNDYLPVNTANLIYTAKAMSHEIGHWYFEESKFFHRSNEIQKIMNNLYIENKYTQTANISENAAEEYRAIFGSDDVRGFFSDNKPYTPTNKLRTLIKIGYMLNGVLSNKNFSNFVMHDTWCEWIEYGFWYWNPRKRALTQNWQLFEQIDGKWKLQ